MQGANTKAEIIALLEDRPEEFLQKVHQFILNADELDYAEFLYPLDPDFAQDLEERAAEAREMLENLREMGVTLNDLDHGKIKIH